MSTVRPDPMLNSWFKSGLEEDEFEDIFYLLDLGQIKMTQPMFGFLVACRLCPAFPNALGLLLALLLLCLFIFSLITFAQVTHSEFNTEADTQETGNKQ